MKSLLISLIAIAACTAQAQQPGPCLKLSKVRIDRHVLHQQDETTGQLTFKTRGCYILHGNELPVMTFEPKPELDVTLSNARFGRVDPSSVGTATEKAEEMLVTLRFIASPDLAVGEHTLRALLTYNVEDKSGKVSSEALAIAIPFKVAPHKPYEKVALPENDRPHEESAFVHGLKIAGMIVVGIPLFIALAVMCLTTGNCWEC
jgi:hypothetical protein